MRRAHYDLAEHASEYREYAESGQDYDEYRKGYDGGSVNYRYADFLLALGEAIMMNHPRFAGLLHAGVTQEDCAGKRITLFGENEYFGLILVTVVVHPFLMTA